MKTSTRWAVLGMLTVLGATPDAAAQYYPPPGYYPPPDYPRPDYDLRPGYRPRSAFGERCSARLPTAYGPRRLICDIVRPRPLGRPCVCPPPPPPPGYPPDPYLNGRVVP